MKKWKLSTWPFRPEAFHLNIRANWSSLVSCMSVRGLPCGAHKTVRDWQSPNWAENKGRGRLHLSPVLGSRQCGQLGSFSAWPATSDGTPKSAIWPRCWAVVSHCQSLRHPKGDLVQLSHDPLFLLCATCSSLSQQFQVDFKWQRKQ